MYWVAFFSFPSKSIPIAYKTSDTVHLDLAELFLIWVGGGVGCVLTRT